jgi:murein DD-endopeptidase MepM/ murein hydrolase activator NlpD
VTYPILASVFILSLFAALFFAYGAVFKSSFWQNNKSKIYLTFAIWFISYALFIVFCTGPQDLSLYPPQVNSPYKLPWKAGVSRFVAQGNRSFTSHRDFHEYAWDFVMPNGTIVLAARAGRVGKIEDGFDGVGLNSNVLLIEHEDGAFSAYAHIRFHGALVKVGDLVQQGQPIALSGMVGQTIFPHLHFYVVNKDQTGSIPISFSDVPEGVPLAGHFYTSKNEEPR